MAGFSNKQLVVIALVSALVVWASNNVTPVRRVIG